MNEAYVILPLFLWLSTCGIIFFFDSKLKKKLGNQSEAYANFRLPRFIAITLNSLASIGIIIYISDHTVVPEISTYFSVPYFGIMAYYITSFFRAVKEERNI